MFYFYLIWQGTGRYPSRSSRAVTAAVTLSPARLRAVDGRQTSHKASQVAAASNDQLQRRVGCRLERRLFVRAAYGQHVFQDRGVGRGEVGLGGKGDGSGICERLRCHFIAT